MLAIVAAGLLFAVCFVFWPKTETLDSVARRASRCFQQKDANCLFELQTDEEIALYGLSPSQFEAILDSYVWRDDAHFDEDSLRVTADNSGRGGAAWTMTRSGTKEYALGVNLARTEDGFRAPRLLATLVLMTQIGYSDKPTGLGREKMQAWVEIGKRDKAKLESLGMKGVYRRPDVGFQTWDEWIAATEERLARPPATPKPST